MTMRIDIPNVCDGDDWPFCKINRTPLGPVKATHEGYERTCSVCGQVYKGKKVVERMMPEQVQKEIGQWPWVCLSAIPVDRRMEFLFNVFRTTISPIKLPPNAKLICNIHDDFCYEVPDEKEDKD